MSMKEYTMTTRFEEVAKMVFYDADEIISTADIDRKFDGKKVDEIGYWYKDNTFLGMQIKMSDDTRIVVPMHRVVQIRMRLQKLP